MRGTRRHARAIGLLACLVLLLGALPVLAWQLADDPPTSDNPQRWSGHERDPRVAQGGPVQITGSTRRPVAPGISAKINLRFGNSLPRTVVLDRVRVRVRRIAAPRADATYPCVRRDFRVRQLRAETLRVPSGATTLRALRVPRRDWPRLRMVNRPVNQDGCKGARLRLRYRADGARWP